MNSAIYNIKKSLKHVLMQNVDAIIDTQTVPKFNFIYNLLMWFMAHEVYTKEISLTIDNTLVNVNLVLSFKRAVDLLI